MDVGDFQEYDAKQNIGLKQPFGHDLGADGFLYFNFMHDHMHCWRDYRHHETAMALAAAYASRL